MRELSLLETFYSTVKQLSSDMPGKSSSNRFGQKLRALRHYHGLTLQELARVLGYAAHGHLSELENGKKMPTVEFVLSVARFFRVTTDQLLMDELELDFPSVSDGEENP